MCTDPIFEASGHVGSLSDPRPICAGLQAARPLAEAGLTATPSGNCTAALRNVAADRPLGLSFCGTRRFTDRPVGAFARASGRTVIAGLNGGLSQPVAVSGVA